MLSLFRKFIVALLEIDKAFSIENQWYPDKQYCIDNDPPSKIGKWFCCDCVHYSGILAVHVRLRDKQRIYKDQLSLSGKNLLNRVIHIKLIFLRILVLLKYQVSTLKVFITSWSQAPLGSYPLKQNHDRQSQRWQGNKSVQICFLLVTNKQLSTVYLIS